MVTFEELGINDKVVKAMNNMGWTDPTPVQIQAIPEGLEGRDIIVQAQTGTGKTGTYVSILLGRISSGSKVPSAIILTPTRELANQVDEEIYKLTKYSHHRSIPVYGGASINEQVRKLRAGTDIIVGTPGRVKDMIQRGHLVVSSITEVVLDEADRMLDMGFSEELDFIMAQMPKNRQTVLFSATMVKEVRRLALKLTVNPLEILVSKDEPTSDLTSQYYISVPRGGKGEKLSKIVDNENLKVIVFCQTKRMVDDLTMDLAKYFKVASIHGDMPQSRRETVIRNYRNNKVRVLIATDVAARGLDVRDIDCVVNYDVPPDADTYIHRIGRTGRAGKEGVSISFITKSEDRRVRMYEASTGKRIRKIDIEDLPLVLKGQLEERPIEKVETVRVKTSRPSDDNKKMTVIQVNLGREDALGRTQISDFIRSSAKLQDEHIGRVGLGNSMSYIEIRNDRCEEAVCDLLKCSFKEKKIFIQTAPKKEPYSKKKESKNIIRSAGLFANADSDPDSINYSDTTN